MEITKIFLATQHDMTYAADFKSQKTFMTSFELFQLFSMSGQKLDALWEFFVTIHLAIFGALFLFHKIKRHQIIILIISYLTFSLINIRAKIHEYDIYKSFLIELKSNNLDATPAIKKFILNYSVDDRVIITVTIHLLALLFLLYLLKESKTRNRTGEQ